MQQLRLSRLTHQTYKLILSCFKKVPKPFLLTKSMTCDKESSLTGGCIFTKASMEQPKLLGTYLPLTVMCTRIKEISNKFKTHLTETKAIYSKELVQQILTIVTQHIERYQLCWFWVTGLRGCKVKITQNLVPRSISRFHIFDIFNTQLFKLLVGFDVKTVFSCKNKLLMNCYCKLILCITRLMPDHDQNWNKHFVAFLETQ